MKLIKLKPKKILLKSSKESKKTKSIFSAKDLALVESLANDGFEIPKELEYQKISKNTTYLQIYYN